MQCLARAVARSARAAGAAAAEGYGGQRFLSTGRAAAKRYIKRRPVVNARALRGRRVNPDSEEVVERILGELRATNAELAKQLDVGLGADLARRVFIHICVQSLFFIFNPSNGSIKK
ncbi:hypothetical protein BDA96_03G199000 [Sorghum bicolor]|uniref:Uncharacterized protein n=1 Tax=Sorghum bicolor TaxID=4558 RepID=A0A921RDX5_SORBI|nr:hypothetical protein BDA96_03G199000 [Sorghum bicolor]